MTEEEIKIKVFERYPLEFKETWCWAHKEWLDGKREVYRKKLEQESVHKEARKDNEQV